MKEIKELYELYNCSAFRFVDELFIKESNRGIFETLKDNRQNYGNFVWDGNGSVCLIKSISDADNFFKLIKGSGCREIALGMESGNDDLLKKMNKLINRQDIKICVKFLFKHDINVKGFFMFGFPGETKEGIADTISLISCLYKMADENNRKFRISVFEFRPYPGTKVWDELVEGGKLQPTQISEMYEQVDITDSGKKSELHDRDEFAYSSNLQFGELSPENVQLIITRLMMIQKNMSSIQQRTGLNAKTELQNIYDDMEDMERGIRDGNFFQQQNKRQERQRNALYSSGSAEKIGLVFSTTLATYKSPALVQITGLRYQAIPGDGHCMYRAVTYYLGHDKDIQFLRGIVAANLESNREMYAEFIPLGEEDLPAYIARIRSTNEWAGELEINILMRLLNRPIVIVGPNNEIRNRDAISHYSGEPIFIYYDDINHYGALIVQDGHDARSILAHSLNQPNNQSTTQVANTTSSFSVQQTLH